MADVDADSLWEAEQARLVEMEAEAAWEEQQRIMGLIPDDSPGSLQQDDSHEQNGEPMFDISSMTEEELAMLKEQLEALGLGDVELTQEGIEAAFQEALAQEQEALRWQEMWEEQEREQAELFTEDEVEELRANLEVNQALTHASEDDLFAERMKLIKAQMSAASARASLIVSTGALELLNAQIEEADRKALSPASSDKKPLKSILKNTFEKREVADLGGRRLTIRMTSRDVERHRAKSLGTFGVKFSLTPVQAKRSEARELGLPVPDFTMEEVAEMAQKVLEAKERELREAEAKRKAEAEKAKIEHDTDTADLEDTIQFMKDIQEEQKELAEEERKIKEMQERIRKLEEEKGVSSAKTPPARPARKKRPRPPSAYPGTSQFAEQEAGKDKDQGKDKEKPHQGVKGASAPPAEQTPPPAPAPSTKPRGVKPRRARPPSAYPGTSAFATQEATKQSAPITHSPSLQARAPPPTPPSALKQAHEDIRSGLPQAKLVPPRLVIPTGNRPSNLGGAKDPKDPLVAQPLMQDIKGFNAKESLTAPALVRRSPVRMQGGRVKRGKGANGPKGRGAGSSSRGAARGARGIRGGARARDQHRGTRGRGAPRGRPRGGAQASGRPGGGRGGTGAAPARPRRADRPSRPRPASAYPGTPAYIANQRAAASTATSSSSPPSGVVRGREGKPGGVKRTASPALQARAPPPSRPSVAGRPNASSSAISTTTAKGFRGSASAAGARGSGTRGSGSRGNTGGGSLGPNAGSRIARGVGGRGSAGGPARNRAQSTRDVRPGEANKKKGGRVMSRRDIKMPGKGNTLNLKSMWESKTGSGRNAKRAQKKQERRKRMAANQQKIMGSEAGRGRRGRGRGGRGIRGGRGGGNRGGRPRPRPDLSKADAGEGARAWGVKPRTGSANSNTRPRGNGEEDGGFGTVTRGDTSALRKKFEFGDYA